MSDRRRLLAAVVIGCGLAGCTSAPRVGYYQAPCGSCAQSGARVAPVPAHPDTLPEGTFIQPQRTTFDPSFQPGQPAPPVPSAVTPPVQSGETQQSTWRPAPADANVRLAPPEGSAAKQPEVHLYGPEPTREPPRAQDPPAKTAPAPMPKVREPENEQLPMVDIPDVVQVRAHVLTGEQPFPDGITWLGEHNYRTVLHLRSPDEQDTAAQKIFEKHGLRYIEVRVAPRSITPEAVQAFNRQAADDAGLPVFVYDRGGSVRGMMWYLYYRTAQGMTDERALVETARLGFRPDDDTAHRAALDAAREYLSGQNP